MHLAINLCFYSITLQFIIFSNEINKIFTARGVGHGVGSRSGHGCDDSGCGDVRGDNDDEEK